MRKLLFYLSILACSFIYSQGSGCALTNLADDLVNASNDFKNIINTNDGFNTYRVLSDLGETNLANRIDDIEYLDDYVKTSGKTYSEVKTAINKAGGFDTWKINNAGGEALSFLEKSKLFVKGENALLRYSRKDGTFFMHKSPSNPNLTTGYSNELTFSFKYKSGPNANSKDVFGKIGVTDEGYIVGNLRKPTGMNNQQIKGITEDAMDMALHHFGRNNVKGIKALWVKNADLYPNKVGNKSINLSKFEKALETMDEGKAVFQTVTGTYTKSRSFLKVIGVRKLEEAIDGVYGYEVIFGVFK